MSLTRSEITVLKAIIRKRRGPGSAVLIADVIKAISYYTKETTKKALISLAQKGVVALLSHDFPQSLKPSERKYFIRERGTGRRRIGGGQDDRYYHAVVIRDDSALPGEAKNPPVLTASVKNILREYVKDRENWDYVQSRLIEEGFTDRQISAAQDFYAEQQAKAGSSRTSTRSPAIAKTSTAGSSTRSAPASSPTQAIVDGIIRLDPAARTGALIALPELRQFLKGRFKTKKAFDDAVLSAADAGKIVLHRHVFPSSLTEKERTDLVYSAPSDSYFIGAAFRNPMKKKLKNKTIIRAKRVIALTNRTRRGRRRNPDLPDTLPELKKLHAQVAKEINALEKSSSELARAMSKEGNSQLSLSGMALTASQERFRKMRDESNRISALKKVQFDLETRILKKIARLKEEAKKAKSNPQRRRINSPGRRNDAGHLRSQKAQLAAVVKSIKSLKSRISKAKDPSLKSGLRALMIEMQGTREDLKRSIRMGRPRRNLEKRDSDHPIEVTRHWRSGPPGYLTPWQRAHAAGQRQLFETGIKPASKRNPKKKPTKKPRQASTRSTKTRAKKNSVRSTVEKFGGRSSKQKTVSVQAPLNAPSVVGKLGKVKKIELKSGRYYEFDEKSAPLLTVDGKNKIHFVGAQYRLNPSGRDDQGPIKKIIYWARKPHLGHPEMAAYWHQFGEEDGAVPRLSIDQEGLMHVTGGHYYFESDGIHN
jgi:hypothetical protein